jgi:genome maintenance exonuclease 1
MNFEPLTDEITDQGRVYTLPDGSKVFSVTTILGRALDDGGLDAWRKRVGEEQARRVSTQATRRGTAVHAICEAYLNNEPQYPVGSMPVNVDMFKRMRPVLDRRVGKIYGVEAPLYSTALRTAGRTDLAADFDSIPSIVDFKTSKRPKLEEHILKYFLQLTTYANMFEERTGLTIPQIAVIIGIDDEDPQVFVKRTVDYEQRVKEIFGAQR